MFHSYGIKTNSGIVNSKQAYDEDEEGPPDVLTGPLRLRTFSCSHQPNRWARKNAHGQFIVAEASIRTPTADPCSSLNAKIAVDKACEAKAAARDHVVRGSAFAGSHYSSIKSKPEEYLRKNFPGEYAFVQKSRPLVYGLKAVGIRPQPLNSGTAVLATDQGVRSPRGIPVAVTRNSLPQSLANHASSHINRHLWKGDRFPHNKLSNISAVSAKSRNVISIHSYSRTNASAARSFHNAAQGVGNKSTNFSVAPVASAFSNTSVKIKNKHLGFYTTSSEKPSEIRLKDVRYLMIVSNRILYGIVKANMLLFGDDVSSYIPSNSLRPNPKKIRIDTQLPKKGRHSFIHSAMKERLRKKIELLRTKYYIDLILAYFLQNGGHFVDFPKWRGKNLPSAIIEYIKCNLLPGKTDEELRSAFEVVSIGAALFGPDKLRVLPKPVTDGRISSIQIVSPDMYLCRQLSIS